MSRKVLLFAPCAFNLAETSRMVEIAKGVRHHPKASQVFDVHFISDGGEFEQLIERHGFPLTRLEPRLTPEKIEHIAKVDRGEKFAPAFTDREMIERVENEIVCLKTLTPVAVVTGSYVTIPVTCRVLQIPLVWVVQSTWLPDFFCHGAGMTDHIRPTPIKALLDWFILRFINFWIRYGFLNPVNRTAKHFGVAGYESIFEFWTGDITLVAEPPEFTGVRLPFNHYFIGPLIPHEEFPMPQGFTNVPKDKPLIYFAMGSSGTPRIVAKIVESFEGKPYHVIAPVEFHLAKVHGVRVPTNVTVTDWVRPSKLHRLPACRKKKSSAWPRRQRHTRTRTSRGVSRSNRRTNSTHWSTASKKCCEKMAAKSPARSAATSRTRLPMRRRPWSRTTRRAWTMLASV